MARKPRIEYPGAFYHVMARGNRKIKIFLDDEDREKFLKTVLRYKEKYDLVVYAFTLMDNHFHLLVETRHFPLSKAMQGMLQSYTQWHNRRYNKVGHLFQGRYKAILCDRDSYLIVLVRYIHLNPVRAGYVDFPEEYLWSSHRTYLGLTQSDLVDVDLVLDEFDARRSKSIRLYSAFINEALGEGRKGEFYFLRDQRVLGDDGFYAQVMKQIKKKPEKMDGALRDKTLEDVVKKVKQLTGIGPGQLAGRERDSDVMKARSLFINLCSAFTKMKKKEIAKFLKRQPGSLGFIEGKLSESEIMKTIEDLRW